MVANSLRLVFLGRVAARSVDLLKYRFPDPAPSLLNPTSRCRLWEITFSSSFPADSYAEFENLRHKNTYTNRSTYYHSFPFSIKHFSLFSGCLHHSKGKYLVLTNMNSDAQCTL